MWKSTGASRCVLYVALEMWDQEGGCRTRTHLARLWYGQGADSGRGRGGGTDKWGCVY